MSRRQMTGLCPCCETLLMAKRDRNGRIVFVKLESSKTKDIIPKREKNGKGYKNY
jgi:predicted DCC family thiol-disulfide oxidoreductase YuxK